MAENPNETVNFYGRKVSRSQLEPLVEFYKADHELTAQDRNRMAADLEKVRNTSVMWGMLDASLAFFGPTMYRRYVTSKATKEAESLRKIPVRRFIHRPMLSVVIGTAVYFTSILYNANKQINSQVDKLTTAVSASESEAESESLKRMLNVWKSMLPSQVTFYYLYYWKSSQDPSFILKDPVKMTQNPHEVHFIPPSQHKRLFGGFVSDLELDKHLPHWEQIRKENGFVPNEQTQNVPGAENSVSDAENGVMSEVESPVSEAPSTRPGSAWERIRKGN